jgi:hypothetical protein
MLDVARELVQYLARRLHAERQARGTRLDTRALTCFCQALLVLVWFRKGENLTLLGAGFGISRATATADRALENATPHDCEPTPHRRHRRRSAASDPFQKNAYRKVAEITSLSESARPCRC